MVSVPERSKGVDSSSTVFALVGSNPTADSYVCFYFAGNPLQQPNKDGAISSFAGLKWELANKRMDDNCARTIGGGGSDCLDHCSVVMYAWNGS